MGYSQHPKWHPKWQHFPHSQSHQSSSSSSDAVPTVLMSTLSSSSSTSINVGAVLLQLRPLHLLHIEVQCSPSFLQLAACHTSTTIWFAPAWYHVQQSVGRNSDVCLYRWENSILKLPGPFCWRQRVTHPFLHCKTGAVWVLFCCSTRWR